MAILTDSRPDHIEPIDPSEEPIFPKLSFTVPRPSEINWDEIELSYDRLSDILLVFVADRLQPAVVVYGDDNLWSYLVNPDTMEFVGWQVESFLGAAVPANPYLISLLDHAELIGLTPDQLRGERQRALGLQGRFRTWLNQRVAGMRRSRSPHREIFVRSLISRMHSPFTSPSDTEALPDRR